MHQIKIVNFFVKKFQIFMLRKLLMKRVLKCRNQNVKQSLRQNHFKSNQPFITTQDSTKFDQQQQRKRLKQK